MMTLSLPEKMLSFASLGLITNFSERGERDSSWLSRHEQMMPEKCELVSEEGDGQHSLGCNVYSDAVALNR